MAEDGCITDFRAKNLECNNLLIKELVGLLIPFKQRDYYLLLISQKDQQGLQ